MENANNIEFANMMPFSSYDGVKHFSLLEKQRTEGLVGNEQVELNDLRSLIYEQLAYNNRNRYLELIDDCLSGTVVAGSAIAGVLVIQDKIQDELADVEEMGEALKDVQINLKSKDFIDIETSLFMLFEFCNDEDSGLTEEYVLKQLPSIREQILAYN